MYDTNYHRPSNLQEAEAALASAAEGKLLAGGHTLIPIMKQRLAAPSDLIDVSDLPELKGVESSGGILTIGAATTHAEVSESDIVRASIPALADLASHIGDPHVRQMGTIGGSVANNDPASDYPAAVLALESIVHTNKRDISAADFFSGYFETALGDDEIIKSISLTEPQSAAYVKFANPASRYAIVGSFVARMDNGDIRVGIAGASRNGVYRWAEAENALTGSLTADAVGGLTVDENMMQSDIHAGAPYRAHLVGVLTSRAVEGID